MNINKEREIVLIHRNDDRFPSRLRESDERLQQLYIRGDVGCLSKPAIAIAGTRKATVAGLKVAQEMAYELGRCGFVIVSGLAFGIDSAAHRGALRAGAKTVAVLGSGVEKIYPAQNESLARDIILAGGAVVSESPGGPSRHRGIFLERNRIISGLSMATIIIEAPYKSGAINTAGWAGKQGKPIFVVPGPVNNINYEGSHKLIRDGATLTSSYKDVLEDLGVEIKLATPEIVFENETEKIIFSVLKEAGVAMDIDTIVEVARLSPSDANTSITMMLIRGMIIETPEGFAA